MLEPPPLWIADYANPLQVRSSNNFFSFLFHTFSICLSCPVHFQDSDHLPPSRILNLEYWNLVAWPDCHWHCQRGPVLAKFAHSPLVSVRPLLFSLLVVWQSSPTYSPLSPKGRRRRQRPGGRRRPPRRSSLVWCLDTEKQIKETKFEMGRKPIRNLHKLLSTLWKTYSNRTP